MASNTGNSRAFNNKASNILKSVPQPAPQSAPLSATQPLSLPTPNSISKPIQNIGQQFSDPKSPDLGQTSNGFLKTNGFIAKFGFILLVLIAFLILFRLGTMLISSLLMPKEKVKLLDGMIDASKQYHIPQNPNNPSAKPTYRSDNEDKGIEFSWSIWINIKDLGMNQNYYKHIFHKGNSNINVCDDGETCGKNSPNNAPGLYLNPNTNAITVVMNTYSDMSEEIVVNDIPLNKWVNIIIRCEQNMLDVYVNGAIVKRHKLSGVPKQNYGDVFMSMNGGFNGYSSSLTYYSKAVSPAEILGIVNKGPNTTMKHGESSDIFNTKPPYLSMQWYFQPEQPLPP